MPFVSWNPGYAAAKEWQRWMLIKTNVRGGLHRSILWGRGAHSGLRRHCLPSPYLTGHTPKLPVSSLSAGEAEPTAHSFPSRSPHPDDVWGASETMQDGLTTTTDAVRRTTSSPTSRSDDVIRWLTSTTGERTKWVGVCSFNILPVDLHELYFWPQVLKT